MDLAVVKENVPYYREQNRGEICIPLAEVTNWTPKFVTIDDENFGIEFGLTQVLYSIVTTFESPTEDKCKVQVMRRVIHFAQPLHEKCVYESNSLKDN